MTVSIIIPVYNVEATLDRCVASVQACPLRNLEIILVDDGSTDRSADLCEHWRQKDPRISVVHKPNGGLSDARNAGIDAATGDYITFADSDDYLADGTLQQLAELAATHPEYDMIEYPINQREGSPAEQLLSFADRVYTDASQYWYETQAYLHTYAVNKFYRRALFRDVRFPVGRVFEDAYTLPRLLQAATVVATTSRGLYHYCYNQQGITAQARASEQMMLLDAHMQTTRMPRFSAYNDARYYLHLADIQIYANELSGVSPVLADRPYYDIRNPKSIILHFIGIKKLCKINRLFRKLAKRR